MASKRRVAPCAVEGCTDNQKARGWCDRHYKRWQHHGTTDLIENPRRPARERSLYHLEEIEHFMSFGIHPIQIAKALGTTVDSLEGICYRYGHPEWGAKFSEARKWKVAS